MEYFVYILQSLKSGRYYVRQMYDFQKRLAEHNGEMAGHTHKEQPWEMIWHCIVNSRAEAMKLEKVIKKRGAGRFLIDLDKH